MSELRLAIVTGASSGIGAEIARLFRNEKNLEIWLVARRREKLDALAAQLREDGAQVKIMALDLSEAQSWQSLEAAVKQTGQRVAWLVNNAGYGFSGHFVDEDPEHAEKMVQLNCAAVVSLSRRFLPYMEKGSHILNVASAIAFVPLAGFAVYAATKAFVLHFSLSLRSELKARGIHVSVLCPGPVATEFFDHASMDAPPKFLIENVQNTAFLAVEKASQSKAIILTGLAAYVARFLGALLPKTWIAALSRKAMKPSSRSSA